DFAKLLNAIRTGVPKVDQDAARGLEIALDTAGKTLGVDIEKDLLGALGDEWAYYLDKNTGGTNILGLVMINRLRNPEKFQSGIAQIEHMINAVVSTQLPRDAMGKPQITISFKEAKLGDLTYHYLAVPAVAPCWAIKGNTLYVALYPQVLQ